nr:type II CAAX endopeptidase family protein [uncultured Duganella sp.]
MTSFPFPNSIPDILFTLYLLVYFPLSSLWRSLRPASPKPFLPPLRSYWRQGRYIVALLCVFVPVAWLGGHGAAELGLGFPRSAGALWGLALAGFLLVLLHVLGTRQELKMSPQQRAGQEAKLRDLPFAMPRTRTETLAYLLTMIAMTTTWELLFRGYLLLVLAPVTGLPLAIVLAAVAYGAGHGYKDIKQFVGSIVAALAFTIGYAVSGSLWWLIVLHAAAPVAMLYAMRKLSRPAAPADDHGSMTGQVSNVRAPFAGD